MEQILIDLPEAPWVTTIRMHSRIATEIFGGPIVLMVGPPTTKQRYAGNYGNNYRAHIDSLYEGAHGNFRAHIDIDPKVINLGGHCGKNGNFWPWYNWVPSKGLWNQIALQGASKDKFTACILACAEHGLAQRFLKLENPEDARKINTILAEVAST